jgi:hypothetical protein
MLIVSNKFEIILKFLQKFRFHIKLFNTQSNDAFSKFNINRKKLINHESHHE